MEISGVHVVFTVDLSGLPAQEDHAPRHLPMKVVVESKTPFKVHSVPAGEYLNLGYREPDLAPKKPYFSMALLHDDYNACCYGNERPTLILMGGDIEGQVANRMFQGTLCTYVPQLPRKAVIFFNANYPSSPKYNAIKEYA